MNTFCIIKPTILRTLSLSKEVMDEKNPVGNLAAGLRERFV
jgi:hypothetical protein